MGRATGGLSASEPRATTTAGSPGGQAASGAHEIPSERMTGEITIRVRYAETDRMGLLHHANYLVYFEQGRTELLRSQGLSYRDMEDQGVSLVLTKVWVRYRNPARYDDFLTLRAIVARTTLA